MPIPETPAMTSAQMGKLLELTPLKNADGNPIQDVPMDVQVSMVSCVYNISWNLLKSQHYLTAWSKKPSKEELQKRLQEEKDNPEKKTAQVFGVCPNVKAELLDIMGKPMPMVVLAALYEEWSFELVKAIENSESNLWRSKALQTHLWTSFKAANSVTDTFKMAGFDWLAIFDASVTDVMEQHKHLFEV